MMHLSVFETVGYVLSAIVFTIPLVLNGIHKKQYYLTAVFALLCTAIGFAFGFIASMGVFFLFLMILAIIEQKKKQQEDSKNR